MVGFDDGSECSRVLDGVEVDRINADLSASTDVTQAQRLRCMRGMSFMGDTKGGSFDLGEDEALELLQSPNPNRRPTSDVIVPWVNGLDITRRPRYMWIVDFGTEVNLQHAAGYESAFARIESLVRPARLTNKREIYRTIWWRHVEARPGMRLSLAPCSRFIGTPRVTKHRLFTWLEAPTLPDSQVIVFAREDDYFIGVLHSSIHELWARAQGTQLRERESGFRYTPSSCFETFAFPEPTDGQREVIAESARELDNLRTNWLNPTEWVKEEILEFPGSADGPWARYVHDPDERGIGTVRYPRFVPRDDACAAKLKPRTLTNLYNQRPTWLDLAHKKLDQAVFSAYGWPPDLTDDEILQRLLDLNLERAAGERER